MNATQELKELQHEMATRKVYVSSYQLMVYRKRIKKLKALAEKEKKQQSKPLQPCLF